MNVIIDTDIWSEAFRKKASKSVYVDELHALIDEGRVLMIGVIRMEILCGLSSPHVFDLLAERLLAFPDRALDSEIFTTAARFLSLCRSKGTQGSNNDFVICACSVMWRTPILTKDQDFHRYQEFLPIELVKPRTM